MIFIENDPAMREFGAALARLCPAACVVYLQGELGAGKSTLVRGFLHALGHEGAVRSPTYTLVEHYQLPNRQIYHLDLYRLADPEELEYLGMRDWLDQDAILLAEWPDRGRGVLPAADLVIAIDYAKSAREVHLQGGSETGQAMLEKLVKTRSV